MNGEYERLILGLDSWLRGELIRQKVPGYLKPLGNEAGVVGEAEGVAADVRAKVMEKAVSVAHDIESGRLPPPAKPKPYFKQVMRNAIPEYFRSQPKAAPLTPNQLAMVDDVVDDEEEGTEGTWGWLGEQIPAATLRQGPHRHPYILTFLRYLQRPFAKPESSARIWREGGPEGKWRQVQQELDEIPFSIRREAVLLHLQGYHQEVIAARLFRSQPAVFKALQKQYTIWGWDKEQVEWIQHILLYVNIGRAVQRGRKRVRLAYYETVSQHNLISEERAVYQAVLSDPALTHWTVGLEHRHMRQLIDLVGSDDDDLYDESDLLDPDRPEWPQLH